MMTNTKLTNLTTYINTLMGESVGSFIISSELTKLNMDPKNFSDSDYDELILNLNSSLKTLLGEQNLKWFAEELEAQGIERFDRRAS